ncbi:MAG: carboxypeptidase-like regulatory domain-containing protein [Ignavibacteriae bacterium]|nr:carboxypeptidase-like regulatory domain-containing protein [Ignavibacteriota bacterium]
MKARYIVTMLLVFALVVPGLSVAGTTGKIKGQITDKASNEALIGATVIVVGTSLGASADVNGEYIILNVPAGTYEIEAKFLGYQALRISRVQVSSDLTTDLDFAITQLTEGVQLSEIVVERERQLVNKNATNAVRIQTGEDIQNLPVRGVKAAIVLSPGIVEQDGIVYVRGGRADEVGYYLEGASTRNVFGRDRGTGNAQQLFGTDIGENLTTVIPEALEEFQVQAGGYTAQYGNANAGIIRQTLRSGSTKYSGSLQVETDNFTSQNSKALGSFSYGYSNYVATLSGPIVGENIKFFVAGENQFDRDWRKVFVEGFRFENLPDAQSLVNPATGGPSDTVRVLEAKSGNVPGLFRNRYTGNGTVTLDYNPLIVRVGGSFTWQEQQGTALFIPNIFNLARNPITRTSDFLVNAKVTHVVSPTVLYEVNVNYGDNRLKRSDPDHGDNFLLYTDSLANAKYGYPSRNYTNGPGSSTNNSGYRLYGFPFDKFGHVQTNFDKRKQTRFGGSFDVTAQVGSVHEFKVGGSIDAYTVRRYAVASTGLLTWYRDHPDQARIPGAARDFEVANNGTVVNYGYDFYGNEINSGIDGPKKPKFYAGYIQDKIEYEDLVINAGLRLDAFDTDDIVFIDDPTTPEIEGPSNPSVDPTTYFYKETGIAKKKVFKAVSPRLGFSFPVSDKTVFHVQFGKFVQAPALNSIYTGRANQGVVFEGGNFIPNPVGFGLDPERTTQYEIGFTQQISDAAAFDITGYYKDIKGQIQVVRQTVETNSTAAAYNTLANGDFATTKGVEVSFRLRRTNRVQAQINYTFADAKGTGSTLNSAVSSLENGTLYPTVISPLDFNNSHRGALNLDYRFGMDDGGPILERLGLNLLFTFNSGHPYTLSNATTGQQGPEQGALVENDPRNSQPREAVNASTTPWNLNIDLRLDKSVDIGPVSANFFIYVQNLLNTKNVLNVYRRSGNADDDGFLTNPDLSSAIIAGLGQRYVELYRAINLQNGTHYLNTTGLDLWGTPRQIRFGVKMEI